MSYSSRKAETTTVGNNKTPSITGHIEHKALLNADAKEFIPSGQTNGGDKPAESHRTESGIVEGRLPLNVFAREFIPANLQNNASVSPIALQEPNAVPVGRPAAPHPVRPRRREWRQNESSVLHFPGDHQPRVCPPFHGHQHVQPPYFIGQGWSTADR